MLNADSGHIRNETKKFYDSIERAEETTRIVYRANQRKYYSFRPARFYGGIGTADCFGCCLRCLFCWSWDKVVRPGRYGKFYSLEQVAGKLTTIACKNGFRQVRISGNEPTLTRDHLLHVLEQIPEDIRFILETNGILIGHDPTYARDLSRFGNLYVRVSMKGTGETEFSRLTGADPSGFGLQLGAMENLARFNVATHPAVMVSFSSPENIKDFKKRINRLRRNSFKNYISSNDRYKNHLYSWYKHPLRRGFFSALETYKINCIADVRRFPKSRKYFHFNRDDLDG